MPESSFELADTADNLSVKYSNLYSINGVITYCSTKKVELPLVNKWPTTHKWCPALKVFNSLEEINKLDLSVVEQIETSVLGDFLWYGNIGHALFDGLYPAYLALLKFGLKEAKFKLLVGPDWDNKLSMAYDVFNTFSGSGPLTEYLKLSRNKTIKFNTLVAGYGWAGNIAMTKDYTLYGEKWNGTTEFKNRMLTSYGLTPDLPVNTKPNVIIVNNKRYSDKEKQVLHKLVANYKDKLNIKFIDWYHDYSSFAEQLITIEDTDIQITGPGTGMLYAPFLKFGAVNINLGYMEHCQTNTARPNLKIDGYKQQDFILPGWMEQSVCSACTYISTLYYDRHNFNDIELQPLSALLDKAVQMLKDKQVQTSNWNTDALVFKEYCKRVGNSHAVCKHLTNVALFAELFVNEHPQAAPKELVNIKLLREIKDELKYDRKYEYNNG